MGLWSKTRLGLCGAAFAGLMALGADPAAAAGKFKVFLSMSYIGNDWQAEAANMVKAMAAHASMADKVDLQVQVAGPNTVTPPRMSEQVKVAPASPVKDQAGLRPLPGVTGAAVMVGATGAVVSRT